ncbi:TAXI family TRAP transporter solute-binding subunit [Dethiobacter alkaliphilus]|uniref:TAXI family TRAP transporter solute-binding subunit n=1 Tax=Dethiobacter alkaliphilus TaxID=427926 RepID=UPI002226EF91|nr:TAXI family TRAP transporter solute-binding subunit [Dethiobacter alkaliphilus]MCW3489425.1 TAXI family TRAP transporter solute-binding subunit [Dethiobacter alkaliphilus]
MSRRMLKVALVVLMLFVALSGCRTQEPEPPPENGEDNGLHFEQITPDSLVIGTASLGGTYHAYGQGWAALISETLDIPVTVEETGGPVHNLIFVETGYFMLGMTTLGPAYEAWFGREEWTWGREHRNIRALFPMYNTYFHWVTDADSGIAALQDMDGRRVGNGPVGGTIGTAAPRIFNLLGINVQLEFGGLSELLSRQRHGLLDANGIAGGVPVPSFAAYDSDKGPENVRYIGVDGQEREIIKEEWPYFTDAVIPQGTYAGLREDLETIGVWNVAIGSKFLDDDLVYEIVKAVLENNEVMLQYHDAAQETLAENLDNLYIVPLHPGAIRYYEEQGIEVPDHLLPPEYGSENN